MHRMLDIAAAQAAFARQEAQLVSISPVGFKDAKIGVLDKQQPNKETHKTL